MTIATLPPSKAHLTKLQIQHAVTSKDVAPLAKAIGDLDSLGSAAMQDLRPGSSKNFLKVAAAADEVVTQIEALKKAFKGANPKFMAAVERDYKDKAEVLWDSRKFVEKSTKELDMHLMSAVKPIYESSNMLEKEKSSDTLGECAEYYGRAAKDCKLAAAVAAEIDNHLDVKAFATASKDLTKASTDLAKLAEICTKLAQGPQPHPSQMDKSEKAFAQSAEGKAMSKVAASALQAVRDALALVQ